MEKTETLEDFYRRKFNWLPDDLQKHIGHFNVFRLEDHIGPNSTPVKYSRRDFYKIMLTRGKTLYHYADKTIETDGSTLMFFNPRIPYTCEPLVPDRTGFFCIFTEAFFMEKNRHNMNEFSMFSATGQPAYQLDAAMDRHISSIFEKMLEEIKTDYIYKYDLLRNYVTELIHFALKMRPSDNLYKHPDANSRITAVFTELLERQFPIETPAQRFTLRSAKDYAQHLAVHVNHLNHAVKTITGKTTTDCISERLISEAKALLKHTDWNISEISYCLGFEEPAHFNNFFKKQTTLTPSSFRVV